MTLILHLLAVAALVSADPISTISTTITSGLPCPTCVAASSTVSAFRLAPLYGNSTTQYTSQNTKSNAPNNGGVVAIQLPDSPESKSTTTNTPIKINTASSNAGQNRAQASDVDIAITGEARANEGTQLGAASATGSRRVARSADHFDSHFSSASVDSKSSAKVGTNTVNAPGSVDSDEARIAGTASTGSDKNLNTAAPIAGDGSATNVDSVLATNFQTTPTSARRGTRTETDIVHATDIVFSTYTSCDANNKCIVTTRAQSLTVITTTVDGIETVYTTYLPKPQPSVKAALASGDAHADQGEVTTVLTTITTTVNGVETVYTTYCPRSDAKPTDGTTPTIGIASRTDHTPIVVSNAVKAGHGEVESLHSLTTSTNIVFATITTCDKSNLCKVTTQAQSAMVITTTIDGTTTVYTTYCPHSDVPNKPALTSGNSPSEPTPASNNPPSTTKTPAPLVSKAGNAAPGGVKTVTDGSQIIVTITSCSDNICLKVTSTQPVIPVSTPVLPPAGPAPVRSSPPFAETSNTVNVIPPPVSTKAPMLSIPTTPNSPKPATGGKGSSSTVASVSIPVAAGKAAGTKATGVALLLGLAVLLV